MKITCPTCGSSHVIRRGHNPKQRYQCTDPDHKGSHRYFYAETSPANILVFDAETLPGWKRFWRLGEEDWNIDSIVYDWMLLGYSYKWLFEPESYATVLTPKEAIARDESRLVKELWNLFDKADIIIAHNGDSFDIPGVMGKFIEHGYPPPSPFLTIDTKTTAKRAFMWTSYKLEYIARKLRLPRKLPTDYDLWVRCESGDKEALQYMKDYNEQDVWTLEDVYVTLRPWIKHPNMGLYVVTKEVTDVCPHCGSDDIEWGYSHRTPARVYEAFRCNHCGAFGRSFKSYITASTTRVIK